MQDDLMTGDEIAFCAAINVPRDSIESGRMPSGNRSHRTPPTCMSGQLAIWRPSCGAGPPGRSHSDDHPASVISSPRSVPNPEEAGRQYHLWRQSGGPALGKFGLVPECT
jgi:hypothetical protein